MLGLVLAITSLDPNAEIPLYRQLYSRIKAMIDSGELKDGFRLPPTRELAASLRVNRTTVSAAYSLLNTEGFIRARVGRGSFVDRLPSRNSSTPEHGALPIPGDTAITGQRSTNQPISFAVSRPSESLFPVEEFRAACREAIESNNVEAILQLGSPSGYAPLRRYLLAEAQREGTARPSDDVLITSGCQQAFDLLQRVFLAEGETVLVEDPVYHGLKRILERAGARVAGIPMERDGIDLAAFECTARRERPRMAVITSNFQNPTGATLPLAKRNHLVKLAQHYGLILVEDDIYGELRYSGEPVQPLKKLDETGNTVLLRSFSKLAFPGLRIGWVIGPRALIEKLAEAKHYSDLHSDHLSQAVLYRFAESGRLDAHRRRVLDAGRERLRATLLACERYFPEGTEFTRPEGGMNLWVRLPEPLDTGELLASAERAGVTYLPGKYFAVNRSQTSSLRLSFAELTPEQIDQGVKTLGEIFCSELKRLRSLPSAGPVMALV